MRGAPDLAILSARNLSILPVGADAWRHSMEGVPARRSHHAASGPSELRRRGRLVARSLHRLVT
jgi:hypothetical protein